MDNSLMAQIAAHTAALTLAIISTLAVGLLTIAILNPVCNNLGNSLHAEYNNISRELNQKYVQVFNKSM